MLSHTRVYACHTLWHGLERLLEKGFTIVRTLAVHAAPEFVDPTVSGLDTLCKGDWLQKHLASTGCDENLQEEDEHGEVDLDYELSNLY